jgi:hypothetical protein
MYCCIEDPDHIQVGIHKMGKNGFESLKIQGNISQNPVGI